MWTAGVDLAAEPKGTAVAVVEWFGGVARLVELDVGMPDEPIVAVAARVDKLGIDCALGWPQAFVDFVSAHADIARTPVGIDGGMAWRRKLAFRQTDRHVRDITGRWPLSVSTDRLGLTALRCAGLLARIGATGLDIDRAGSGLIAEVYPGASLRRWGFDTSGYRVDTASRERVLSTLASAAPWLELDGFHDLMVSSADAFDAVIAALAARAAWLGLCEMPPPEHAALARKEGWIALPDGEISDLLAESNGHGRR